jgi:hypothetical protein
MIDRAVPDQQQRQYGLDQLQGFHFSPEPVQKLIKQQARNRRRRQSL